MEKFKLKDIPKLPGNTVLVDNTYFKTLVEYMNKQTEVINTMTESIELLNNLCENHSINITELKRQIATLANVLGGQIHD